MSVLNVRSGNAELAAEVRGTGAPVVFLHAGVADRRMWQAELAALAAAGGYRGVAYDRRGFGESLHADERYSHVADLAAVLDATAGGAPAVLVGCSQGGRIAIDAALALPERVRALVLVAPAISGAPEQATFPPAIEAWIARMEKAEAQADVDRINALEAHAWLDGPLAPEGRVGGDVRTLFLEMNGIALRAEQRGTEIAPEPAYDRVRPDRRAHARRVGRPRLPAPGRPVRVPRRADAGGHVAAHLRRRAPPQSRIPGRVQSRAARVPRARGALRRRASMQRRVRGPRRRGRGPRTGCGRRAARPVPRRRFVPLSLYSKR